MKEGKEFKERTPKGRRFPKAPIPQRKFSGFYVQETKELNKEEKGKSYESR